MKIKHIQKTLRLTILMTILLALPIVYTIATDNAIYYTLSEDKKSAVIHIDVNKVIGSHELVEVKDQDNNKLTKYDITVTENGVYSYTVIYKEAVTVESETVTEDTAVNQSNDVLVDQSTTTESSLVSKDSEKNISEMPQSENSTEENPTISESQNAPLIDNHNTENQQVQEDNQPKETVPINHIIYETRNVKLEINVKGIIKEEVATYNLKATQDEFLFSEETGTITGYDASVTGFKEIVDQIAGKDVLYIGENALAGQQLTKVTFMTTKLKGIGNNAFQYNYMEEIAIPASVETIGNNSFFGCKNLVTVHFESETGVKSIGESAFSLCESLVNINIPKSVTILEDSLFHGCEGLISMDIPIGITEIGLGTFSYCKNLTSISIPEGVTYIGDSAFSDCHKLSTVTLPDSLTHLGNTAFYHCALTSIKIPEKIDHLSDSVFSSCSYLNEVILPNGLTTIDNYAFYACTELKSISLPNSVVKIGDSAFEYAGIISMILPQNLNTIGNRTFYSSKLESISIPANVQSIGNIAFAECQNLISITLECGMDDVILISESAFHNDNIKDIYILNRNAGSMEKEPWEAVYATIHWKDEISNPLIISVGEYEFNTKTLSIHKYRGNDSIINIPQEFTHNGVTYEVQNIGYRAFSGYNDIYEEIIIPDTVIHIGAEAFANCVNIKKVKLSNNLKTIGYQSFAYTSLISVEIPSSVTEIDDWAFQCQEGTLKDIYILDKVSGSINAYDENWGAKYAKIHWKDKVEIPLVVRIGEYDYHTKLKSIYKYYGTDKNVDIPRYLNYTLDETLELEVQRIGSSSFESTNIESISIPNSVIGIDSGAFRNCKQLANVELPNTLEEINAQAFENCSQLEQIVIPHNVRNISSWAFSGCSQLKNISLSDNITLMDSYIFEGCTLLKNIKLPRNIGYMAPYLFQGSQLERIYIDQPRGSIDSHSYQPWGIQNDVQVFYQGESVEFRHSVENNTNGGYDVYMNASILKNGVFINRIELPNGNVVRVGAQSWPSKDSYVYHVDNAGVYTFKGYDNRNIEYTYDVKVEIANITYHSNISSTNDTIATKETLFGKAYVFEDHNDLQMTRDDAVFMGWNTLPDGTGNLYHPGEEINVNGDITLYAQWKHYADGTVLFKVRKGDETLGILDKTEYVGVKGEKLGSDAAQASISSVDGATFIGWYKNNRKVENISDEIIGENTVYEARFVIDRNNDGQDDRFDKYKVNFIIRESDKQKATLTTHSIEVGYNQKIGNQVPGYLIDTEIAPNVTFDGWYKDGYNVSQLSDEVINNDVTYEARFNGEISRYRMNFVIDMEDGYLNHTETYISQIIEKNGIVSIPVVTVHNGKKFIGWYKKGDENQTIVDEANIILETTTYAAKVENLYQVTFKVHDGDNRKGSLDKSGIEVVSGTKLDTILPTITTQKWAKFIGWYNGEKKIEDPSQHAITENTILEARFAELDGVIIIPGIDGTLDTSDDIIVQPGKIDSQGNVIIPDGGIIIYPDGSEEDFPHGGIILPSDDGTLGTQDDIIVQPGVIDDKGNIVIPDGGIVLYPDGTEDKFPDGGIILPGTDDRVGTVDDIVIKPGKRDDNGNIQIPEGGIIVYPDGTQDEFPNGGIILPGTDGELGTNDDLIIKPGRIDEQGNAIIPDGGIIIYPDGTQDDFPAGGVIVPGEDAMIGTDDDIIMKPGTIDDKGNIVIPDGGMIFYPDGSQKEFPNGGVIEPGLDGRFGTEDDVIFQSGSTDNNGNIVFPDDGTIVYPDDKHEEFPSGGIVYPGVDEKFGTKDDLMIRFDKNKTSIHKIDTYDNTQILFWSIISLMTIMSLVVFMKKKS